MCLASSWNGEVELVVTVTVTHHLTNLQLASSGARDRCVKIFAPASVYELCVTVVVLVFENSGFYYSSVISSY